MAFESFVNTQMISTCVNPHVKRATPNTSRSSSPSTNPSPNGTMTTLDDRLDRTNLETRSPSPANIDVENVDEPEDDKSWINRVESKSSCSIGFSIDRILDPNFGLKKLSSLNRTYGPRVDSSNRATSLASLGNLCKTVTKHTQFASSCSSSSASNFNRDTTSPARSTISTLSNESHESTTSSVSLDAKNASMWPAWVFCTRYSDRPSSGPRSRRMKKPATNEEKRPRTAFSGAQLARLKHEFTENRYLTEKRRQALSAELGLNEAQIKIWFQNKRAKIKKSTGQKNPLALQLMAQGLYNHTTVPLTPEEEELQERLNQR